MRMDMSGVYMGQAKRGSSEELVSEEKMLQTPHHAQHHAWPGIAMLARHAPASAQVFNFLHYFPQYSRDTRPGACIANIVIPDSLHNSARLVALMPPSGRIEHPLAL